MAPHKDAHKDDARLIYDYILIRLAQEYVTNHNEIYGSFSTIQTIEDFNKENNFTKVKILLLPYFISTANGHLDELLKLFGTFRAADYGHKPNTDFVNIVDNNLFEYFQFADTKSTIQIKDADIGFNINNYLENAKSKVSENIFKIEDLNRYKSYIDDSFNAFDRKYKQVKQHSIDAKHFALHYGKELSFFSKYNPSWEDIKQNTKESEPEIARESIAENIKYIFFQNMEKIKEQEKISNMRVIVA